MSLCNGRGLSLLGRALLGTLFFSLLGRALLGRHRKLARFLCHDGGIDGGDLLEVGGALGGGELAEGSAALSENL